MTNWLQISDLHFADEMDARTSNFERGFWEFCKKNTDIDFVIATGDFRQYESASYQHAKKFLQKIMEMMDLDIETDLFIVPGNHDVNINRHINAKEIADDCNNLTSDKLNILLSDFSLYKQFAAELIPKVYENSDASLVHVRRWKDKINILHLNTCLISDGKRDHKEMFDINTVCSESVFEQLSNDCPILIIGHHSLSDIHKDILDQFVQFVNQINRVSAYLAGDQHIPNPYNPDYLFDRKFDTCSIPNIVTGKLIPSLSDNYSKIWFIKHCWNESISIVEQQHYEWNVNGSGREFTKHSGDIARSYVMQENIIKHMPTCDKNHPFKYNSGTTTYIGREAVLAKLQNFLDENCYFPVVWWAITGLGGSGKSRIAYEIGIKNKKQWQIELIHDAAEISISDLNQLLYNSSKNMLLILDTYISDFSEIAKWMKKCNEQSCLSSFPKVRIIFLRREFGDLENVIPEWVNSMIVQDPFCMDYLYKQRFIQLEPLCEEEVCEILESYLKNVYPQFKYTEKELHLLMQTQKKMGLLNRPLFSMFLADAYANKQAPLNWDEERILQYTYKREKQIIFEQYEQAFHITPLDFPKVFECIENLYAAATISGGKMNELLGERWSFFSEMIKATNLDQEQIIQRMQAYGILRNGKLNVIEPDIVGEYFVLQRYLLLETIYTDLKFYTRFFRDLYKILNSTHEDIITEILTYDTGGTLELAYAIGLFELTAENIPLEIGIEAMGYLQKHVPNSPLALGAESMGRYLAYGLSNIILKQNPEDAIPSLLTLEQLYKNNPRYPYAEAYVKGLINANKGQWYPFVLSELLRIYKLNYKSNENETINEITDEYFAYLSLIEPKYTKEQIKAANQYCSSCNMEVEKEKEQE